MGITNFPVLLKAPFNLFQRSLKRWVVIETFLNERLQFSKIIVLQKYKKFDKK